MNNYIITGCPIFNGIKVKIHISKTNRDESKTILYRKVPSFFTGTYSLFGTRALKGTRDPWKGPLGDFLSLRFPPILDVVQKEHAILGDPCFFIFWISLYFLIYDFLKKSIFPMLKDMDFLNVRIFSVSIFFLTLYESAILEMTLV